MNTSAATNCWNCGGALDFDTDGNGRTVASCPTCAPVFALARQLWQQIERARRQAHHSAEAKVDPAAVPTWAQNEERKCACGSTIVRKRPGLGRWPTRCGACQLDLDRQRARESQRRKRERAQAAVLHELPAAS